MPIAIALLRSVNVGGKNVIPMSELRELCAALGLEGVRTYIQSGNVVFEAPKRTLKTLGDRLAGAIEKSRGFRPGVVVRTLDELRQVAANNPFGTKAAEREAGLFHVMFLSDTPGNEAAARVATLCKAPGVSERVMLVGREAFIHFPSGAGKAKLTATTIERALGVMGTCRNWNTVRALIELGEA